MKRPMVFHENDRVRVVVPRVVDRVGYPKCVEDYIPQVDVARVIALFPQVRPTAEHRAVRRIVHELAHDLALRDGFGGRKRSIHEHDMPELSGLEGGVVGVRSCRTGTYWAGGGCGEDYDPPFLTDARTHRLVLVQVAVPAKPGQFRAIHRLWMRRENVELVRDDAGEVPNADAR